MNSFPRNLFLLVSVFILFSYPALSANTAVQNARATAVIDGDTIQLEGGAVVRYLGIDAPEIGEPFYEEAKNKNKELLLGKTVRLEVCRQKPTDKYGRLLAYVYTDEIMVNKELLRAGYARILTIPPCGLEKAGEFRQDQKEAMWKGIGLWGKRKEKRTTEGLVSASDVTRFLDERKAVYGRVLNVRKGRKAIFLEIGSTAKVSLRVVIFESDKENFEDFNIDAATYYFNKDVVVYGRVKLYKGFPEIVVGSPSQIEVW